MSQALYRKHRPTNFEQVVGQEHVTRTLRNAVAGDRVGHAYLFCGPRGTGKTTTARLVAKAVNCTAELATDRPCNVCGACLALNDGRFLDLIEIDAASNTGVDDIRDLRDKISFSPGEGRFKVYIIDEVHMLSTAAFNALLKTLEEPPAHAIFVLATTEEHKVPATIKSRCQQFNFRLLTTPEIVDRLKWLVEQEALDVEPEALNLVARQGAGSIRDAESLLDQLITAPGDTITLDRTQKVLGTASTTAVRDLVDAWQRADGAAGLAIIHDALASGADPRQFCRQMVTYLRELLLLSAAGKDVALDLPADQKQAMLVQAREVERPDLITAVKKFNEAALTASSSWQPQLPLEMAFVELLPAGRRAAPRHAPRPADKSEPAPQSKSVPTAVATPPAAPPPQTAVPVESEAAAQPQTVESPPETTPEPAAPGTLSLKQVTQKWPDLLDGVGRLDRNLPALLTMSKPLAVEGETLVLGFDYPIFKDKFDAHPEATHLIGRVLSELLAQKCHVRGVQSSAYIPPVARDDFQALADELGGIVRE